MFYFLFRSKTAVPYRIKYSHYELGIFFHCYAFSVTTIYFMLASL